MISKKKPILTEFINESVHTSDDVDIGDIYAVNRNFIVVKRGFVNIHFYYIPLKYVQGWDGSVIWLITSEKEVKKLYEKKKYPNPHRFFIKEYPWCKSPSYPTITVLAPKYKKHRYTEEEEEKENKDIYICPLCNKETKTENQLNKHVESSH